MGMNFEKEKSEVRDSIDTSYIRERSKVVDRDVQKTFLERKWVWVPDSKESFISGWIVQEKGETVEVDCDGNILKLKSTEVMRMNPPKFDMVEDLAALSHLNEPSVLFNLTKRYNNGHIYTYSGLFLLAINPYRNLNIYSNKYVKKYTMSKKNELEPHIFAVANEAYNLMLSNRENQSILITGESGAGKTENTKKVIEFLAAVAGYKAEESTIDKKIIDSNPILEAFGNAKTVKNDNSSRFGKFIQIKFNGGNICGANIEKYLLEKSRITRQNSNERNYHIFYQLLTADSSLKQALFLDGSVEDYRFLRGGCSTVKGVDDSLCFKNLRECMKALDIDEQTELFYYKIVAAVLHLGNLEFRTSNRQVEIVNIGTVDKICKLLKISSSAFVKCLIHPVIKAGQEIVTQHRTVEQVYRIVEALAKILYDKMFDSLISNLNLCLGTTINSNFIGVLDIAGFEIFKENSFEQLCINFTNEKLQQFFNHHMFILEQEIYKQENIDWDFIDFGLDLQPTIDLIESSNPIGILSYLDEECVMPCASEKTFLDKLFKNIKSNKFKRINFREGFTLQHYAGDVNYSVDDWITKNKDPNFESITSLINMSEDLSVSSLSFTESRNLKKGFFRTVSQKHKEQLHCLVKTLSSTHPHFVRCIIPNLQKTGDLVENKLILEQLECNGVLEGIRISRQGFPSRMKYCEFVERYRLLSEDIKFGNQLILNKSGEPLKKDNKEMSRLILESIKINQNQFRLGKTRIFFRQSVLADIEDARDNIISGIMREVQAIARRRLALNKFNVEELRRKSIVCLKKNASLCVELQKWNWWKLYLKIKPLLDVRKRDNEIKEKENDIKKYLSVIDKEKNKVGDLEKKVKELLEVQQTALKNLEFEKQYSHEKDELMSAIRNKNEELEKKLEEHEKDNSNIQLFLEKTLEKLKVDSKKYENSIDLLKKDLELSNRRIKELLQEVEQKEMEVKKSNLKILNSESERKTEFENLLELKEKEIKGLKKEIEEQEEDLKNFKGEIDKQIELNSNSNLIILNLEKENLNQQNESLLKDFSKVKRELEDYKQSIEIILKKVKDENSDLQIENEKLENSYNKLLRQSEEKQIAIKKASDENEFLKLTNSNLSKNLEILREQLLELERKEEKEREDKLLRNSTQEGLLDKIKGLEKKVKSLSEKVKHYEILNNQLTLESEEFRKENLNLVQSKLDEIFQRESQFNTLKKNLQLENQKLSNENQRLTRELYDLKIQSESSDDSNSATDKLYSLLEQEKKGRREAEQRVIEIENMNLFFKNELEEIQYNYEDLLKERDTLKNTLSHQKDSSSDYQKLNKDLDSLLENINLVIGEFNTKYFNILEDSRKRIRECLGEIKEREEKIKIFELSLVEKQFLILDLEKKNGDLVSLNSIGTRKINNLLNEFDTLKVLCISLETEIKEKNEEIEMYKGELSSIQELVNAIQGKYKEEISTIKRSNEERSSLLDNYRVEQLGTINNLKLMEDRNRKFYEEELKNILELEDRKKIVLKSENDSLRKNLKDSEEKLSLKNTLNLDLSSTIYNLEIEIVEIKERLKEKELIVKDLNLEIESFKKNNVENIFSISKNNVLPVTDKQKLMDLERKKLIYKREVEGNKEIIGGLKKELEESLKVSESLKKEMVQRKSQLFELRKNWNTQSVLLSQVERELKDEKELVGVLRPFFRRNKK